MSELKEFVRTALRKRNIEVGGYRHTVVARRQKIMRHYDIGLLVDVGANVGQYAKEARRAGYTGRIMSIEPVGQAFSQLQAAASDDPLWQTVRTAVGSAPGRVTMRISEGSIFSSVLPVLPSAQSASPNSRQVATEEVPLARLDDLVEPDVAVAVKIDVQGYERDVLNGAPTLLDRARVVEIELSPEPVYDGQMLMPEAVERLSKHGLVLSLVENLFPEPETGRALQFNGLFVRP